MGDAAFQEKAKARIRNLLDRTQAVVLVSHDLTSLRELCTRGLWIQQGRLVDDGPVDLVIDRYLESISSVDRGGRQPMVPWSPKKRHDRGGRREPERRHSETTFSTALEVSQPCSSFAVSESSGLANCTIPRLP